MKKTRKLQWILLVLLIIHSHLTIAQSDVQHDAPTLQVGLDGLTFSKGNLDAQIILQIVADKQSEIKLKVIQGALMNKLDSAGGAVYSFADNLIRGIVTEKDPDIITKKILENTTNIALTYAFADYYIRYLERIANTSSQVTNFNSLLSVSNITTPTNAQVILIGTGALPTIPTNYTLKSLSQGSPSAANTSKQKSYNNQITNEFIQLILDMSSEAIRHDPTLNDLGILDISYSTSYEFKNKYLNAIHSASDPRRNAAIAVFADMQTVLSEFTDMIGLIYYHTKSNTYKYSSTISGVLAPTISSTGASSILSTESLNSVNNVQKSIQNLSTLLISQTDTSKINELNENLKQLTEARYNLQKAANYIAKNPIVVANPNILRNYSDIVFTIYRDIIPAMRNASKWDPALLNSIDTIETHILRPILDFYRNDTTNPLNNTWVYNNLENFIQLLSLGYQFDDTAPFSSSVKILSDLQGVIPNDRINDVISLLNTFVKDFISIQKDNEGKELIAFNVESYLSHLSQIKPDKYRKGSFLFTVGTGNIWFDTPYRTDASSTISTLGFVSEKIGFKFKVIDKNWKSRSPGDSYKSIWGYNYTKLSPPKEPLISDVHLLFYGSGILYNIINTSTNKNFTSPIVSAGFGVTFFNNLDFNLSVGTVPNTSISTLNNTFYGIGFDVPFMEYLERVNENQKAKRTQKLLAEAND